MATYDNLPVYKACYSLLLMLFNHEILPEPVITMSGLKG
jgi:hypothetical protein